MRDGKQVTTKTVKLTLDEILNSEQRVPKDENEVRLSNHRPSSKLTSASPSLKSSMRQPVRQKDLPLIFRDNPVDAELRQKSTNELIELALEEL